MTGDLLEILKRGEQQNLVRRVGQALWMHVGTRLEPSSLLWAKSLLGHDGDKLLWSALSAAQVVSEDTGIVRPAALAAFLCALAGSPKDQLAEIVWSLPQGLQGVSVRSYAEAAYHLITHAEHTVMLVSPFIEHRGVGKLLSACVDALHRDVSVTIVTHAADDLATLAASSLEELRREAVGKRGLLTVFAAARDTGVLLHSKIILGDESRVLVGSANITGPGLSRNLETGVVLTGLYAAEVSLVVNTLIKSAFVTEVFRNRP